MITPHVTAETFQSFDKKEWRKEYNAKNADKRHAYRKKERDDKYLSRPIVAIDGEGLNVTRGPRKGAHDYVMLAISDAPNLIRKDGLHTAEILDYLHETLSPDNINVIYGGSYDFNCWLASLTRDEVARLYKSDYQGKPFMYRGYAIRWMKGKSFSIKKDGKRVEVNDVISFFQRPFIAACDEYLGTYEGRDILVREKARRGNFRMSELRTIDKYNQLELRLLVRLVGELRTRLDRVGLRPRRWNSPGAIASALFKREGVTEHRSENIPAPVAEAARYAYAGGRFEMLKYGASKEAAYEYDINSAYPRALTEVPSLVGGEWKHETRHDKNLTDSHAFALYHVRFRNDNPNMLNIPAPMFHRAANGTISYPTYSVNWIWSPEYDAMKEYCEQIDGAEMFVLEAWKFTPGTDHKPFGFIPKLYAERKLLKAAGDGAHVGIKLALNSMYGKTAQQVGWQPATAEHPLRIPAHHQLEWAGFVTSWCRAKVLRAALNNPHAIIAFETDALFSSAPLDLDIGDGLGEWEETRFTSLTYVQSGHYYGTLDDGKEVVKCRGIDKGEVTRADVETALTIPDMWERQLVAPLTRFYGAGIALVRDFPNVWRKWLTEEKTLRLFPVGKRSHGACWCEGTEFEQTAVGQWHFTYVPIVGSHSHEYPIAWINPNPDMSELEELRNGENYYDD